MREFIPWDSQPLDAWAEKHAPGKFVDLDGRRTHYVEAGEGPPVILIHGFNYDLNAWNTNIDAFAGRFKVYALDLWGSGFSTREPMDYGFPLFAEQIRSFMDCLDIPRAHLVGHSMGGGTAIFFSVKYPGRVDRLVLIGSVGIPRRLPLRARLFMLPWIPELLFGLRTNAIRRKNLRDYWIHNAELLTDEYFERVSLYQKPEAQAGHADQVAREPLPHSVRAPLRVSQRAGGEVATRHGLAVLPGFAVGLGAVSTSRPPGPRSA
jgi:pimeloyl-ACP methyl ester carboxylesterase